MHISVFIHIRAGEQRKVQPGMSACCLFDSLRPINNFSV